MEIGEQIIVVSPSGEPAQGFIIGSINQSSNQANGNSPDLHRTSYDDGAVIEYNREAHTLKTQLPSGATTELISDGDVNVIGDLTVEGNIKGSRDIIDKTRSMNNDRLRYSEHVHPGVTLGLGNTQKTLQQK